jgi:hypothetical protein
MKKLLLLFPILLTLSATAQTSVYHPFPDSNAIWNYHLLLYGIPVPLDEHYSIIISGDTVINSISYQKLSTPYVQSTMNSIATNVMAEYKGAIRQDIVNRRVFIVPPAETTEQLLYDFTMQAGDTVRGYIETGLNPADIVESIDSVLVGSDYRKRWKINSGYDIYFIEGIGSTYGLIEHSPGFVVDWASVSITCFSQNGQTLYPDTATDCPVITSVNSLVKNSNTVMVFPNPSSGFFTIEFGEPANIREVRLTDLTGNIVLQYQTNKQTNIKIDNLHSGIYFLNVIDKDNRSTTRKIIICP